MRLDTVWLRVIDRWVRKGLMIRLVEFNWRLNLADHVALLMRTGNVEADAAKKKSFLSGR